MCYNTQCVTEYFILYIKKFVKCVINWTVKQIIEINSIIKSPVNAHGRIFFRAHMTLDINTSRVIGCNMYYHQLQES
jgi:hypothetical protein